MRKKKDPQRPDWDFFTGKKKQTYDHLSITAYLGGILVACGLVFFLFRHLNK